MLYNCVIDVIVVVLLVLYNCVIDVIVVVLLVLYNCVIDYCCCTTSAI